MAELGDLRPGTGVAFIHSDDMSKGAYQPQWESCATPATEDPASVAIEPWVSLDDDGGWVVTSQNGLIGRNNGLDPLSADPVGERDDWLISYELDPQIGADLHPVRVRADDDTLSPEQRQLLIGNVLGSPYLIKLGILGAWSWRCFFDNKIEEYDFEYGQEGFDPAKWAPVAPIPVLLKVITGRGEFFRVQEFRVTLTVPNMTKPRAEPHAVFPGYFSGPVVGVGGRILTGADSQYEAASFLIDPYGGARRVDDIDPWGIG